MTVTIPENATAEELRTAQLQALRECEHYEAEARRFAGIAQRCQQRINALAESRPKSPDPNDHIGHRCAVTVYVSGVTEFSCSDCHIQLRLPVTVDYVPPRRNDVHSLRGQLQLIIRGGAGS